MTLLRPVGTLLRRQPSAWLDALRTVALAAMVEIGLRTVPVTRLARVLRVRLLLDGSPARTGTQGTPDLSPRELQRLDIAWRVLRRRPFNQTCLRRSLVAAQLLRRRDHAVRIGVQKVDGAVTAHAWLELDGLVLDSDGVDRFRVLATLDGQRP